MEAIAQKMMDDAKENFIGLLMDGDVKCADVLKLVVEAFSETRSEFSLNGPDPSDVVDAPRTAGDIVLQLEALEHMVEAAQKYAEQVKL
jgi:hypothetical protein